MKGALTALVNTGAGVCLGRRLAACGQEASKLVMLDAILYWCSPDIRRGVAAFVVGADIESLCLRENHFMNEHQNLVDQEVFAAQGHCGRKGIRCSPHDERAYLDLEHHYTYLLEVHAHNMSRGAGCLRRYADAIARFGLDSRARVLWELLRVVSHADFSPVVAPACSCGARKSMPRATFWKLLKTEPLNVAAASAIEMHFAARREEINADVAPSLAAFEYFEGREETRLREMAGLYPENFTRAWNDVTVNSLSGATIPEERLGVPPDTVQCYLSDMWWCPRTDLCYNVFDRFNRQSITVLIVCAYQVLPIPRAARCPSIVRRARLLGSCNPFEER